MAQPTEYHVKAGGTPVSNRWSDRQIEAGARWASEIEQALASARVVLLLVSPSFLASDFIDQNELGPVLAAARDGSKKILGVLLSQCLWDQTAINDYQAAHDISRPLDQLSSSRQNAQLKMVADAVARLLGQEERQAEEKKQRAEEEKRRAEAARLSEEKLRAKRIQQVLSELANQFVGQSRVYVAPEIPRAKEANARVASGVPVGEVVYILFDYTVFGSAKDCMVAGQRGIFFSHRFANPRMYTISYERLKDTTIPDDDNGVKIGEVAVCFRGGNMNASRDFLRKLQDRLRTVSR